MGEITAAAQTVARRVTEAPDHWVATLARLGYATIGVVYLMIGTLATQAALGTGGAIADTRDVLVTIARQPFGRVLLGLTALGLSGYVLWRLSPSLLGSRAQRHGCPRPADTPGVRRQWCRLCRAGRARGADGAGRRRGGRPCGRTGVDGQVTGAAVWALARRQSLVALLLG